MKTTFDYCFSNGTEWQLWVAHNCDRCYKQSKMKKDGEYTKYICKINAEIDGQAAGFYEITQRTYNIVQMRDCPYRKEKRKTYKQRIKDKSGYLPLFE